MRIKDTIQRQSINRKSFTLKTFPCVQRLNIFYRDRVVLFNLFCCFFFIHLPSLNILFTLSIECLYLYLFFFAYKHVVVEYTIVNRFVYAFTLCTTHIMVSSKKKFKIINKIYFNTIDRFKYILYSYVSILN